MLPNCNKPSQYNIANCNKIRDIISQIYSKTSHYDIAKYY
jgi:hypothetical protein